VKSRISIALILLVLLATAASTALALPEYATQTGEPCGTCHASASGGGLRTPRGLAWVARQKPASVPTLEESLVVLGVKITGDPADYLAPTTPPLPAAPLATRYERKMLMVEIMLGYAGN
jgi:hypothetical protein